MWAFPLCSRYTQDFFSRSCAYLERTRHDKEKCKTLLQPTLHTAPCPLRAMSDVWGGAGPTAHARGEMLLTVLSNLDSQTTPLEVTQNSFGKMPTEGKKKEVGLDRPIPVFQEQSQKLKNKLLLVNDQITNRKKKNVHD